LVIQPDSALVGQTVGQTNIRQATGVTLVALLRSGGGTVTPNADTTLEVGDELIVLGTREQLSQLEELTGIQHFVSHTHGK
jgi:K+/H+ antiporter YhaU regulatory subunit KhtT